MIDIPRIPLIDPPSLTGSYNYVAEVSDLLEELGWSKVGEKERRGILEGGRDMLKEACGGRVTLDDGVSASEMGKQKR